MRDLHRLLATSTAVVLAIFALSGCGSATRTARQPADASLKELRYAAAQEQLTCSAAHRKVFNACASRDECVRSNPARRIEEARKLLLELCHGKGAVFDGTHFIRCAKH